MPSVTFMTHVHALIAEYDRLEAGLRDMHDQPAPPPALHCPDPPLSNETFLAVPQDGCNNNKVRKVSMEVETVIDDSDDESKMHLSKMIADDEAPRPQSLTFMDGASSTQAERRKSRLTRQIHDKDLLIKPWNSDAHRTVSNATGLTAFVQHDRFYMLMTALILLNTAALAFEVQYEGIELCSGLDYPRCEVRWSNAANWFLALDWMFGIFFCLESAVKIAGLGREYFKSPANWVDIVVIIAFLVNRIYDIAFGEDQGNYPQLMRLCRLLRLARLSRIIRTLEKLDQLYVMITSLQGMARTFLWALILLTIILVACALFLAQAMQGFYFAAPEDSRDSLTPEDLETRHKLYQYFGTFTRCLLSMYEITLGNWPPVARLLTEHVTEWFTVLAVLHKMLIGFAVVGVLNGVVLQETFKVAQTDDTIMVRQKRKLVQVGKNKMKVLLTTLDTSGDGDLEFDEFLKIGDDPEIMTWLSSMDIEVDDLPSLFRLIDLDRSGSINMEELALRIPRIKGTARSIDTLEMKELVIDFKESMEQAMEHHAAKLDRLASKISAKQKRPVESSQVSANQKKQVEMSGRFADALGDSPWRLQMIHPGGAQKTQQDDEEDD